MSQQICSYPQFIIRTTERKGSEWFGLDAIHHQGSSAQDAVPCSHVTKINAFKRQQMCLSVRRLNRDRAFPVVHLVMIWKKVLVRYACNGLWHERVIYHSLQQRIWVCVVFYLGIRAACVVYFIWASCHALLSRGLLAQGCLSSIRGLRYHAV